MKVKTLKSGSKKRTEHTESTLLTRAECSTSLRRADCIADVPI